jgi:hypothetical protein
MMIEGRPERDWDTLTSRILNLLSENGPMTRDEIRHRVTIDGFPLPRTTAYIALSMLGNWEYKKNSHSWSKFKRGTGQIVKTKRFRGKGSGRPSILFGIRDPMPHVTSDIIGDDNDGN